MTRIRFSSRTLLGIVTAISIFFAVVAYFSNQPNYLSFGTGGRTAGGIVYSYDVIARVAGLERHGLILAVVSPPSSRAVPSRGGRSGLNTRRNPNSQEFHANPNGLFVQGRFIAGSNEGRIYIRVGEFGVREVEMPALEYESLRKMTDPRAIANSKQWKQYVEPAVERQAGEDRAKDLAAGLEPFGWSPKSESRN